MTEEERNKITCEAKRELKKEGGDRKSQTFATVPINYIFVTHFHRLVSSVRAKGLSHIMFTVLPAFL